MDSMAKCSIYTFVNENDLFNFVFSSKDVFEGQSNLRFLKVMYHDKFSETCFNNIELHFLSQYGDAYDLKNFMTFIASDAGSNFWRDFFLYSSLYIANEKNIKKIACLKNAFQSRSIEEVVEIVESCLTTYPENAAEIYVALLLLFPDLKKEYSNRVILSLLNRDNLPVCISYLLQLICESITELNLDKTNFRKLCILFVKVEFNKCSQIVKDQYFLKSRYDKAVDRFLSNTEEIIEIALRFLTPGPNVYVENFLMSVPFIESINGEIDDLFKIYICCYIRLGLFDLDDEHLMTSRKFFDESYASDNRIDLFGDFCSPYIKVYSNSEEDIFTDHLQMFEERLKLLLKLDELIKPEEEIAQTIFFNEHEYVQYLMIAFSHFENLEKCEYLFNYYKNISPSNNVKLLFDLNMLYIYGINHNIEKTCQLWKDVVNDLKMNDYLHLENTKGAGSEGFVSYKNVAEISTIILRNALLLEAMRTKNFNEYALMILFISDLLPETYVNQTLISFIIHNITPDDVMVSFTHDWHNCIRNIDTLTLLYNKLNQHCKRLFDSCTEILDKKNMTVEVLPMYEVIETIINGVQKYKFLNNFNCYM